MISSEMRDTIDHAKLYTKDPVTGEIIPFHEKALDFGELMQRQRELDGGLMRDIPFMPTVTATFEVTPETALALNRLFRDRKNRRPIRNKRRRK